jgi:hypothetical protein
MKPVVAGNPILHSFVAFQLSDVWLSCH